MHADCLRDAAARIVIVPGFCFREPTMVDVHGKNTACLSDETGRVKLSNDAALPHALAVCQAASASAGSSAPLRASFCSSDVAAPGVSIPFPGFAGA